MNYILEITETAKNEIVEINNWYADISKKLTLDFENQLDNSFVHIQNNPLHFQKRYKKCRIRFTNRFPYGIYYVIDNKIIVVIGVIHTSRNHKHILKRIKT